MIAQGTLIDAATIAQTNHFGTGCQQAPALRWLIAASLGICLERCCFDPSWQAKPLLGTGLCLGLMGAIYFMPPRLKRVGWKTLLCAGLMAGLFFLRTLPQAELVAPDHIGRFFQQKDEATLRLSLRIITTPTIAPAVGAGRDPNEQVTICQAEVLATQTLGTWQPTSGRVRWMIEGSRPELLPGDVCHAWGELKRPRRPLNPGDFDQQQWLKSEGIHALLVSRTELVERPAQSTPVWWWAYRWRSQSRRALETLSERQLSPGNAQLVNSMLLGDRRPLEDDVRTAFAESGTLHVLAISGMNVGLLWLLLRRAGLVLQLGRRTTSILVVVLIGVYAGMTDAESSVVRAALAAMLVCAAGGLGRPVSTWQIVGLAGLLVLVMNPLDLLAIGTQLTFLSVLVISEGWGPATRWSDRLAMWIVPETPVQSTVTGESPARNWFRAAVRWLAQGYTMALLLWLISTPLVAQQFQLYSPMGFLVNVLLAPLVAVIVWLGYLFLLLGPWVPYSALLISTLLNPLLDLFLWLVQRCGQVTWGHFYAPGPSVEWLVVYYALLLGLLASSVLRHRLRYATALGIGLIVALTPVWSLVPGHPHSVWSPPKLTLRCIAVGHGLCMVLRCPNGATLVYDAGGMSGGASLIGSVQRGIWATGARGVSAAVLSHGDSDHVNTLELLCRHLPVGVVAVSPGYLQSPSLTARAVLEGASATGTAVRIVTAGDRILLDPTVAISVLHPKRSFQSTKENPHSVTLLIEYAGRSMLLTGDLEGTGLAALLSQPRRPIDVLLAPHHGSPTANTRTLADWAAPEVVIASSHDVRREQALREVYENTPGVYVTALHGAVNVTITPEGTLTADTFRPQE